MFSTKCDFLHLHVKSQSRAPAFFPSGRGDSRARFFARACCAFCAMWSNRARALSLKRGKLESRGMDGPSLKRAGALLFLGTVQFLFSFILAEIYYPGYDVSANY